jgi:surface protein
MDDSTIKTAVTAWFDDRSGAEATYGNISTWDTGGVTDMSWLFCASSYYCNTAASSFNDDISAWDTSGVTTMSDMFFGASAFDQPIPARVKQAKTRTFQTRTLVIIATRRTPI